MSGKDAKRLSLHHLIIHNILQPIHRRPKDRRAWVPTAKCYVAIHSSTVQNKRKLLEIPEKKSLRVSKNRLYFPNIISRQTGSPLFYSFIPNPVPTSPPQQKIQINEIVFLIKLNEPSRRVKLFFNFISLFVRQMSKFAVERVDIRRKRV